MFRLSPACLLIACSFEPVIEGTSATNSSSGSSTDSTGPLDVTTTTSTTSTSTTPGTSAPSETTTGTTSDTSGGQDTSGGPSTTAPSTTEPATCGDGALDPDEECDDGATLDGDECSALCQLEFRRIFVTSAVYTGDLGGRAGADAKCQEAAGIAAVPGTFRAWLSTDDASPATVFTQSKVPYVRLDGVQVAADWVDLIDGSLEAPINVSELGGPPTPGKHACAPADALVAWTSTTQAGKPLPPGSCENWTSANGEANVGRVGTLDLAWSVYCPTPCAGQAALYCVQQ